jgi:hypothetical protein
MIPRQMVGNGKVRTAAGWSASTCSPEEETPPWLFRLTGLGVRDAGFGARREAGHHRELFVSPWWVELS